MGGATHQRIANLLILLIVAATAILGHQTANCQDQQAGASTGQALAGPPQARAQAEAEELQKENRLPEWANYICYQDAKNMETGLFMLIGYQSDARDAFFHDRERAKEFGYSRGLTYQEYLTSDSGVITTINMPMSQESYAEEIPKAIESGGISLEADQLMREQIASEQNAIAITDSVKQEAAKWGIESGLLKDEETLALLDAPEGTNYHNYLAKHPGYPFVLLYRQKYYSAGISDMPGGTKVYREGNVIFESDFGSDVFETAGTESKSGGKSAHGGLATRIQMEETATGLRFIMSRSLSGSSIGIPIAGGCDLVRKK